MKAPGFGDRRKLMLEDIAILTGAQVIAPDLGVKMENATLDMLGRARKVTIKKDETTIVDGAGDSEQVAARIQQLKWEMDRRTPTGTGRRSRSGWPKLAGGVALIRVGAATEVELKEKKHRIEDALSATRAAIEEGIVPGGGTALLRAREAVRKAADELLEGDRATGARIVAEALAEPLRWIAQNAGLSAGTIMRGGRGRRAGHHGPRRHHRRRSSTS